MNEVDNYILAFPNEVQEILDKIRTLVKNATNEITESIAYGMPAYKINGKPLVYFAAYKKHIGFYAIPTEHEQFSKELSKYKQGKGSVQFPLAKTIPYDLIGQMIEFKIQDNLLKTRE